MTDEAVGHGLPVPEGTTPTGSHRIPPATAAMLSILLLLGVGTSVMRLAAPNRAQPSDVDLSVPDWRLSPDEIVGLGKVADTRRAHAPATDVKEVEALLRAFEAFNATDLAHRGDPRSHDLKDAHAEYQQWARTAYQYLGADAYMGLGERLRDEFTTALKRGEDATVRRLSGSYRHKMRATGLIDDAGRPTSSQAWRIASIGFMTHWCLAVNELRPIDELLGERERIAMLRWKLGANPLLKPERREAVGQALRQLGSPYPVEHAIAARAAAEGDWKTAARYYEIAAARAPEDVSMRANAALAAAKVER